MEEIIKKKEYMNAQIEAHRLANTEDWDETLKNVLFLLYDNNAEQKMIETVLQHWDGLFDVTTVMLKVIREYMAPRNVICYMLKKLDFLEDLSYLLEKAIELKKNNNYDIFATNIISYFSDPHCMGTPHVEILSISEAENILENAYSFQATNKVNCDDVIRFFKYYIGNLKYVDVPKWVSLEEGENLSLITTVSPGLPFEERASIGEKYKTKAKELFYSVKKGDIKGKTIDVDMQKSLDAFLSVVSAQNSSVIHNPNRIFGPSNSFKKRNCVSDPEKEGPCRMLECRCIKKDVYETEDDGVDWFTGRCEQCLYKIRDRSHAIRMPLVDGGWDGCFCGFKCLETGIPFRTHEINLKIEAMKYTLVVDGIMDRAML